MVFSALNLPFGRASHAEDASDEEALEMEMLGARSPAAGGADREGVARVVKSAKVHRRDRFSPYAPRKSGRATKRPDRFTP